VILFQVKFSLYESQAGHTGGITWEQSVTNQLQKNEGEMLSKKKNMYGNQSQDLLHRFEGI